MEALLTIMPSVRALYVMGVVITPTPVTPH